MTDLLLNMPVQFYLSIVLFGVGTFLAFGRIPSGMGIPMLAVLATVFFWYVGDVVYNDYGLYRRQFSESVLERAWGQVGLFLASFLGFLLFSRTSSKARSRVYELYHLGNYQDPEYQQVITVCFRTCVTVWTVIVIFTLLQSPSTLLNFILPFLGDRSDPFARSQIGGGFSAVISLGQYLYLLTGAGFGIVLALSDRKKVRRLALLFCVSIWSFFILDRTRNAVLVVILPSFLAWVFIRVRVSMSVRLITIVAGLAVLELWFSFVMEARGLHKSVASSFFESGVTAVMESKAQHEGLNMFQELCWITKFLDTGRMTTNNGQRYFSEMVNFIPRGLWSEKPLIGLDYAIARGQSYRSSGAVTATISTGMIGQGTTNFGTIFGPIFAGFLMTLWVRVLAAIDVSTKSARLPLVFLGLVLTFNMGRDISLLILYPFFFGYFALAYMERRTKTRRERAFLDVRND